MCFLIAAFIIISTVTASWNIFDTNGLFLKEWANPVWPVYWDCNRRTDPVENLHSYTLCNFLKTKLCNSKITNPMNAAFKHTEKQNHRLIQLAWIPSWQIIMRLSTVYGPLYACMDSRQFLGMLLRRWQMVSWRISSQSRHQLACKRSVALTLFQRLSIGFRSGAHEGQ